MGYSYPVSSQDARYVANSNIEKMVVVNGDGDIVLSRFNEKPVSFGRTNHLLLTTIADKILSLWDIDKKRIIWSTQTLSPIINADFNGERGTVTATLDNHTVITWRLSDKEYSRELYDGRSLRELLPIGVHCLSNEQRTKFSLSPLSKEQLDMRMCDIGG